MLLDVTTHGGFSGAIFTFTADWQTSGLNLKDALISTRIMLLNEVLRASDLTAVVRFARRYRLAANAASFID